LFYLLEDNKKLKKRNKMKISIKNESIPENSIGFKSAIECLEKLIFITKKQKEKIMEPISRAKRIEAVTGKIWDVWIEIQSFYDELEGLLIKMDKGNFKSTEKYQDIRRSKRYLKDAQFKIECLIDTLKNVVFPD